MRAFAAAVLVAAAAFDPAIDHADVADALAVANSSLEATRRAFHGNYRFPVNVPPVDFLSVVTPFRRIVLAAESDARLGRRMFGQREAFAALRPEPDRFEVFVELTFHPHNTYIGVPEYTIALEPVSFNGAAVLPDAIDRLPRFGARLEDSGWYPFPYPYTASPRVPGGGEPLLGGTLLARIAGARLRPDGVYSIVIRDEDRPLAQVRVDLARLR